MRIRRQVLLSMRNHESLVTHFCRNVAVFGISSEYQIYSEVALFQDLKCGRAEYGISDVVVCTNDERLYLIEVKVIHSKKPGALLAAQKKQKKQLLKYAKFFKVWFSKPSSRIGVYQLPGMDNFEHYILR